jgi:folate-binding protein YgfZ
MDLTSFRTGAAVLDHSDRTKLHFKGEQAFWFLDQLLTNQIEGLGPGTGADALLLTPKGRIVSPLRVLAAETSAFTDAPSGLGERLRNFFEERIFATKVEIRDRTDEFTILTILGPEADVVTARVLEELAVGETKEQRDLGLSLPGDTEHDLTHYGASVAVRVTRPIRGIEIWAVRPATDRLTQALRNAGATFASEEDFAGLCAVEGTPRFGTDFDESFLPQEAALERAVHFEKGCYLGQEAVAMAQRGRIKRRLRHLAFDGDPAIGPVHHAGSEVGRVTSIGSDAGKGYGVATIKTVVGAGETVEVESRRAHVRELPGTTEGPAGPSAREIRERLEKGRAG